MSKNRLHSVVQRFNLNAPEGGLLTDKNKSWWMQQDFSDLTGFQVDRDLEIVEHLEEQKAAIDQKLMELSNTEPWCDGRKCTSVLKNVPENSLSGTITVWNS